MTREQAQTLLEAIRTLDVVRQDRDEWRQVSRDWRVRAESAEAEVRRLREQLARLADLRNAK